MAVLMHHLSQQGKIMAFKTAILALSSVALTPIAYTDKTTGEKAFIKRMTLSEREAYSNAVLNAPKGKSNAVAFSHIVVDQNGNRIFGDDDIDAIGNLPENVVFDALQVFNKGLEPTSIEQAEKN